MDLKEKIDYVKNNFGITKTFMAKKIGVTYNLLNRYFLDKSNKNYRKLPQNKIKKLETYLDNIINKIN